jgi:integrase
MYVGVEENEFNNNAVVKKKLYGVKRRLLQYNKNFRNSSIGKMRYKDITRGKIINFLETELNTNLALKTKYNIFVYVKTAINYMISNGNIKIVNIFNTINIKNDRRQRTRVLSIEEIELLLKECQKWDKPLEVEISRNDSTKTYKRVRKANHNIFTAVYLAVITAARSSTVLTIKKKDIDLKNQTITLINHKAKNAKYKIPLNASSVRWFEKKLKFYKDNDYLIQPNSKQGKRLVGENNSLTFIPREVFNIMNELFNKDINRKVNFERDDMVNFHTIRRSVEIKFPKKK